MYIFSYIHCLLDNKVVTRPIPDCLYSFVLTRNGGSNSGVVDNIQVLQLSAAENAHVEAVENIAF